MTIHLSAGLAPEGSLVFSRQPEVMVTMLAELATSIS